MKTSEGAELVMGTEMKPQNSGRRSHTPVRISRIPMEWMDPMSWRLPSGKALAEFWLQSGFLAPIMLGSSLGPVVKHKKTKPPAVVPPMVAQGMIAQKKVEDTPEQSGSFRET
jgi:hypothetical protein